jgi:hypothetical protein
MKTALIALAVVLAAGFAHARYEAWLGAEHQHSAQELQHSGGTDAYGCHTDRKTGSYHCH